MPSRYFPRTPPWSNPLRPADDRARRGKASGSTALIVVFIFFLFSALGLGMLDLVLSYLKVSAAKKTSLILDYTAENGVKQAFARLCGSFLRGARSPEELSPDRADDLMADARVGGVLTAEDVMGVDFPFRSDGSAGDQRWTGSASCALDKFVDGRTYFLADYRIAIEAEGRLSNSDAAKSSALDLALKAAVGRIPLSYFPFLLADLRGNAVMADLLERRKIEFLSAPQKDLAPRSLVTSRPLIPREGPEILAAAGNIKLLRPGQLSRAELRSALGLEMIDAPVPDGVYLLRSEAEPAGIFVQGDLESMLLAVDSGWQYILFTTAESDWLLKFSPDAGRMEFRGSAETFAADRIPLGMILVNGKIGSLSAATVGADDTLQPAADPEIPCLLGVPLTIVSADSVTIDSNILSEGARWMNGVPYLKDKRSRLSLYAGGLDLIDGTVRDGRIVIGPNAPSDLKIQASLTSAGSFEIQGGPKTVLVSGGLQTAGLDAGESRLQIAADSPTAADGPAPSLGPAAVEPVLLVLSLRPLAWTERR